MSTSCPFVVSGVPRLMIACCLVLVLGNADAVEDSGKRSLDDTPSTARSGSESGQVKMVRSLDTLSRGFLSTASGLTHLVSDSVFNAATGASSLVKQVSGSVLRGVTVTGGMVRQVDHAVGNPYGLTLNGGHILAGSVAMIVAESMRSTVTGTFLVAKTLIDVPQRMIQYATTMLGAPYKWGGNAADSGLDCSGFVREVVQTTTGTVLPRTAREMSQRGAQVAYSEMMPGDLVFFNTRRRPFSHVGIYLGDGRFMHGASGKKSGRQVRIDSFDTRYYRTRFNGARRLPEVAPPTNDAPDSVAIIRVGPAPN